jgi:hydroxymethylpyrimidine pyrophosphatase-like HAD family hydrolase
MRFHALACDYDGTIATDSFVPDDVVAGLDRVRASGRRIILVTGRQVDDLLKVFPRVDLFDRIVAENGAVLYDPRTQARRALGEPPPLAFDERLRQRGVAPISRGHVIIATWRPHETVVLQTIQELGLELQVIFNKEAVMILPSGVNKATGLAHALQELRLSAHNAVGVGDAENDHAFLALCECSVAVANALPAIKERVDWVTAGSRGAGVLELAEAMVGSDLANLRERLSRHRIPIGKASDGQEVSVVPYGENLLLAGTSGGGKSTFATAFVEALAQCAYQFCIIDPEGDFSEMGLAATIGDAKRPPTVEQVLELLEAPDRSLVVNLLGLPIANRAAFFAGLLPRVQDLRTQTGRPQWLVIDEAHHLLPDAWDKAGLTMPVDLHGLMLITVHPAHVSRSVLSAVHRVIAVGSAPGATIAAFAQRVGVAPPGIDVATLPSGEAVMWTPAGGDAVRLKTIVPRTERHRLPVEVRRG